MIAKLRSFMLGSLAICLSALGCSASRTCCKPCMEGEGIPLENAVAFAPADGDAPGTIVDGQIIQVPSGSTGAAPAAPQWQQPAQGTQVPPIIHPMPPPRQSTSGKPADTGTPPDVKEALPKETTYESKKAVPEKIDSTPAKKDDVPPPTRPTPKNNDATTQQLPKTTPKATDLPIPPVRNTDMRPASLRVKVTTTTVVANVGDRVTFEITVGNQGGMAISSVDLQATLNDNLRPLDSEPLASGRIERNAVTFLPIRNLGTTPQRFKVRAEVVKQDGGVGLITVEALSPILTSGPLKDQATVRILPKD